MEKPNRKFYTLEKGEIHINGVHVSDIEGSHNGLLVIGFQDENTKLVNAVGLKEHETAEAAKFYAAACNAYL
jgi:hypothetical protein